MDPKDKDPGIYTQGIFISLVVDDATKVDPEKIKKQMLLYGERIVKEMSTKGDIFLYIMDKGNYSKNNIINRMEIVSLKDKRLQEAMSHWEEEETKDLSYVSSFLTRAWQKKFWIVQYSVTKNGKEKGVDISLLNFKSQEVKMIKDVEYLALANLSYYDWSQNLNYNFKL